MATCDDILAALSTGERQLLEALDPDRALQYVDEVVHGEAAQSLECRGILGRPRPRPFDTPGGWFRYTLTPFGKQVIDASRELDGAFFILNGF